MKKGTETNKWDFLIKVLEYYVKYPVKVGMLILGVLAFVIWLSHN
jgi:hypothetical protein